MIRSLSILLASATLFTMSAHAQVKGAKKQAPKAEAASYDSWKKANVESFNYSFSYPKDWVANQSEHYDPDIAVDMNAENAPTIANAIEINREEAQGGAPYVLVYAYKKDPMPWSVYGPKIEKEMNEIMPMSFIGVDTTAQIAGYPAFDYTYAAQDVKVRHIIIWAHGNLYGAMYTTLDDPNGKNFRANMPDFDRLLKSLEIRKP
jgi:hypothetical protein